MSWKPWLTPVSAMQDMLYEIPAAVIRNFWNRVRPDLQERCTKKLKKDDLGLNEKAWGLGTTGYVQQLELSGVHDLDDSVDVLLTCICRAEMESSYYNLRMKLRVRSQILISVDESSCTCISSKNLGTRALCKHVLAVLHALRYVTDFGKVPEWPTLCTSREQAWGVQRLATGTADLRPDRADVYAHYMNPLKRDSWNPKKSSPIPPEYRIYSAEKLAELRLVTTNLGLSTLERYLRDEQCMLLPRTQSKELENPFKDVTSWPAGAPVLPRTRPGDPETAFFFHSPSSQEDLTFYIGRVEVSSLARCAEIEQRTRRQSSCPDWKLHRSGRITSTFVKRVVTAMHNNSSGREKRRTKLANDIWKPADLSHITAVRRGKALEAEAVNFFVMTMKERGYTAECFLIGLVLHPAFSWFGASPDRLVKLTKDGTNDSTWDLLEVKTYDRGKLLEDLPYLTRYSDTDDLVLHRNHAHYYQVQSALLATGLSTSYLMVYGSKETKIFLQKVDVDLDLRDNIYTKCSEFYFKVMLTEIQSKFANS